MAHTPGPWKVGDRVFFKRAKGWPLSGTIVEKYDFHGFPKFKVRSNGMTFARLPSELYDDDPDYGGKTR